MANPDRPAVNPLYNARVGGFRILIICKANGRHTTDIEEFPNRKQANECFNAIQVANYIDKCSVSAVKLYSAIPEDNE